jgi:hypothetical protein
VVNTEDFSQKDLTHTEPSIVDQLTAENQSLLSRVRALEEAGPSEGVEGRAAREALIQEKKELLAENSRLKDLAQSASKVRLVSLNKRKRVCRWVLVPPVQGVGVCLPRFT